MTPPYILTSFVLETAACSSQQTKEFVLEPSDFILLIIGLAAYVGAVRLAILSSNKNKPKIFYVASSKEHEGELLKLEEAKDSENSNEKYWIFKYAKYFTLTGLIIADICFILAGLCVFITNDKEVPHQAQNYFFAGLIALGLLHLFSWCFFIRKVSKNIAKRCEKNSDCPKRFWQWLLLLVLLLLMNSCPIIVAEFSRMN